MVEMHYITGKKLPTPANMTNLKKSRCFTTRYVHIAHFKTSSFISGSLLHFYWRSLQMSTLPTRLQNHHHHHLIIGWGAATFKFEVFYWKLLSPRDKISLSYPKAMFSQNTVISVDDFKSVSTDGFSDTSLVQKWDLIDNIIHWIVAVFIASFVDTHSCQMLLMSVRNSHILRIRMILVSEKIENSCHLENI